MQWLRGILAVIMVCGFFLVHTGCEKDTFEKGGKEVDKAVEKAKEEARNALDKMKKALE